MSLESTTRPCGVLLIAPFCLGLLLLIVGCEYGPERVEVEQLEGAFEPAAEPRATDAPAVLAMAFEHVLAGSFAMGSEPSVTRRSPGEDLHLVTITRPFAIARTEVTRHQWLTVMGREPQRPPRREFSPPACGEDDCPVTRVLSLDAFRFCNQMSALGGLEACYIVVGSCPEDSHRCGPVLFSGLDCDGYRLPTEAEWEYAARADGGHCASRECLNSVAWHRENADQPQRVAQLEPNGWGLYDMQGNVIEMTMDRPADYQLGRKVDPLVLPGGVLLEPRETIGRGGGVSWGPNLASVTYRLLSTGSSDDGFRVVRTLH